MPDRDTSADDAERGQAKHAAAALDCEARRVRRFAPTCAEHMARGARIIRSQAARFDAVLAECAALREEAVAHAKSAGRLRERRMQVVEGRAYRVEHALLRAKRDAAARIERAAKGGGEDE